MQQVWAFVMLMVMLMLMLMSQCKPGLKGRSTIVQQEESSCSLFLARLARSRFLFSLPFNSACQAGYRGKRVFGGDKTHIYLIKWQSDKRINWCDDCLSHELLKKFQMFLGI